MSAPGKTGHSNWATSVARRTTQPRRAFDRPCLSIILSRNPGCRIAPAIRELQELGFIEITVRGRAGNREFRSPNKYRLTYRPAKGEPGDGTHEWRWVGSSEQAHQIAKRAREASDQTNISVIRRGRTVHGKKNKIPVMKNASLQCRKPSPRTRLSQCRKTSRPQ
jgi:hypothetical protein